MQFDTASQNNINYEWRNENMSSINYNSRIEKLKSRYNPDKLQIVENRVFSETQGLFGDTQKYVRMAMMAVDSDYTAKSKQAGEAAKEHLKRELTDVKFRYQGSVMTDTHIKGSSDIDLLVICTKFNHTDIDRVRRELNAIGNHTSSELSNLRSYSNRFSHYQGNCYADLRQLRLDIERVMSSHYTICDISKPKSVKITNQNLHRDVDVVTSCWYDSFFYVLHGEDETNRAISIYNKDTNTDKGPDYPFLSISRINNRSAATNGRLKRMIRFLKNVRSDSDKKIDLTSFEINAICYDIPTSEYQNKEYKDLVNIVWSKMYHLWKDEKTDDLTSVVGNEYVFKNKPDKVAALKLLEDEVWKINQDLK